MKLKEEYFRKLECQEIKGFIQYFSTEPFVVGRWNEKGIDVFHENATKFASIGDATGQQSSLTECFQNIMNIILKASDT